MDNRKNGAGDVNSETSKKVTIELPFSGFYESVHDSNIDQAIEDGFNYDYETDQDKEVSRDVYDAIGDADIDWDAIRKEYAWNYTDTFGKEFELELDFDIMTSPREYNFGEDRIFATVPADQINRIREEVENHPNYAEYIKEKFTSRSGFWSNFSKDSKHKDWTREVLSECQYRTILEFWLEYIQGIKEGYWIEYESWLADEFEMGSWDSVINAHEKIEKYIKEEK